jgi:hypothetical protein
MSIISKVGADLIVLVFWDSVYMCGTTQNHTPYICENLGSTAHGVVWDKIIEQH